jgi:leucyl aminopeptidase (aminopeptidase T)
MEKTWQHIAQRMVAGLGVQPGELIDVRDFSGNMNVLMEVLLAIERVGATPLLQFFPSDYLERLLIEVPKESLSKWDQHRQAWMKQIDRVLVFDGAQPDFSAVNQVVLDLWRKATHRLSVIEESRQLPFLLVAIPNEKRAQQLGLASEELEAILLPALGASKEELQEKIGQVLNMVRDCNRITICSGNNCELSMEHGDRIWLKDDGCIDDVDKMQGAIVSNLPAGSIYTTVLEDKTCGSLWLPRAGQATNVVFQFAEGRIVDIEATTGAELLAKEIDGHTGESRRVSHFGVGLNPYLDDLIGWTIVDEHVFGQLFLALGENRYMGGKNQSSLNVDYVLAEATLEVDGQLIFSQ